MTDSSLVIDRTRILVGKVGRPGLANHFEAAHARHVDVDHGEIRIQRQVQIQSRRAIRALSDNTEIRPGPAKRRYALADDSA